MFDSLARARLQDLHLRDDPVSGLRAIIAIHNTRLGPALGGCRCLPYQNHQAAIEDAIALAQGMSYKAAIAGLPLGGGKAVIILPEGQVDRAALFAAFGDFVESLGGRYITAVDSGTELSDLDQVAARTAHVVGTGQDGYDPSPLTARGVLAGLRAAVQKRLGRDSLSGLRVAIQGTGHVGSALARALKEEGAELILADADFSKAENLASELNARICSPEAVFDADCDVFSPCALGHVLSADTIARLRCGVVAGAANNQLASPGNGRLLAQRNILYAPDYVINAGGLIRLALSLEDRTDQVEARVDAIGETLHKIFQRQDEQKMASNEIADRMAEEVIYDL